MDSEIDVSACMPTQIETARLGLVRFSPAHAPHIAGWVETDQELHWLAPNTPGPLTAEKVIGWKNPGGTALVALDAEGIAPVGYGELNPMKGDARHVWIGHVVVSPSLRGSGIGQTFVRALLTYAFETIRAQRVTLVVFPENRSALRCYESVGFTIVQEERHRFGTPGKRHRLLRLTLDASRHTVHMDE